ncbi:MAG: tRNA 4-thiouridine(8) synthase ThiI, partial [Bacilli bacterium]|nr:tRNA 4-thiouridine(8) synthase ThiI [Bacilli bacterium]
IINGESIGQVASQTLTSMSVINEVVKIPVIRPLACFDKSEIIKLAKQINSYETSIIPFEDCCTLFVPKHPVINPNSEVALNYESLIPYDELIKRAIKEVETIKISTENKDFSNIL